MRRAGYIGWRYQGCSDYINSIMLSSSTAVFKGEGVHSHVVSQEGKDFMNYIDRDQIYFLFGNT